MKLSHGSSFIIASALSFVFTSLNKSMQEKTVQDVKKMWHNTRLKARQDGDLCSGSQFPSNQMKKVVSYFSRTHLLKMQCDFSGLNPLLEL